MISIQNLHIGNKQFSIFGSHLGLSKVSFTISKRPTSTSLFHHIIIRTMWSRYGNKAKNILMKNPTSQQPITQRHYPGHYRLINWKKTISENDKRRLNLTQHETTHENIQDTRTGKIEAIMTSAQNKSGKNTATFDKIDPVKVNGTYMPQKNPVTGQIDLDKDGKPIPDAKKGGQYMATLSTPRQLGSDTKHLYDVNKKGQEYVDKHEKTIEDNINKNRKPTLPKKIGDLDDE